MAQKADASALTRALACFDRAITLRRALLADGGPWMAHDLAGLWLNRGDLLFAQPEALRSYDEAIRLMALIHPGQDPESAFVLRHALAWHNRGNWLLSRPAPDAAAAGAAFRRCLDLANAAGAELGQAARVHRDQRASLAAVAAGAWTGLARVHALGRRFSAASAAASQAVRLAEPRACVDRCAAAALVAAAESLCHLATPHLTYGASEPGRRAQVSAAVDAAEAALAAVRHHPEFPAARHAYLRRFAAAYYARHQPRFLAEFLAEFGPFAPAGKP